MDDTRQRLSINLFQPEAGEIFAGHYRIEKELGAGGMGRVYLVTHTMLNKPFALKIILPQRDLDEDDVQRFLNEAKTLHELQHENIVRIFEFGMTDDSQPYQILDYIDGPTLSRKSDRPVDYTYREKLSIALQVSEGLRYAHSHGVLHRDIKSSNIIVQRLAEGKVKASIIDFGIAKADIHDGRTLTRTGDVVGSPAYVSPEQALGHKLDARADLYSLGVVLYELFTGRLPFEGENPMVQMVARLNEQPPIEPLRKAVPPSLQNVILRCLARDRDRRYADAGQLSAALSDVIAGRKVAAASKLSPKMVAICAGAACLALAFGFFAQRTLTAYQPPDSAIPLQGTAGSVMSAAYDIDQKAYQYYASGQYEDAIDMLKFGEQAAQRKYAQEPTFNNGWFRAENKMFIGQCYIGLKKYADAEPYLAEAWSYFSTKYPYNHSTVGSSANYYAMALKGVGKEDEAKKVRDSFAAFRAPPKSRSGQ
jgi:predicted Ser/Thr protein kinase